MGSVASQHSLLDSLPACPKEEALPHLAIVGAVKARAARTRRTHAQHARHAHSHAPATRRCALHHRARCALHANPAAAAAASSGEPRAGV